MTEKRDSLISDYDFYDSDPSSENTYKPSFTAKFHLLYVRGRAINFFYIWRMTIDS